MRYFTKSRANTLGSREECSSAWTVHVQVCSSLVGKASVTVRNGSVTGRKAGVTVRNGSVTVRNASVTVRKAGVTVRNGACERMRVCMCRRACRVAVALCLLLRRRPSSRSSPHMRSSSGFASPSTPHRAVQLHYSTRAPRDRWATATPSPSARPASSSSNALVRRSPSAGRQ